MLKRLYVDNFRCLVDFELNFDSINLFLGDNGAGKSTVFDVLSKLQLIITTNIDLSSIFKLSDYTRWKNLDLDHGDLEYEEKQNLSKENSQKFELKIEGNGGIYKYELKVFFQYMERQVTKPYSFQPVVLDDMDFESSIIEFNHEEFYETYEIFVVSECLWFNEEIILNIYEQKVEIFLDNGTLNDSSRYNYSQSIIPLLKPDNNNKKIIWFRDRIKRLAILKITPNLITSESSQKNSFLTKKIENFVSWYRYIFVDNQNKIAQLTESLQEILDGFVSFKLESISEKAVILKLIFKTEESDQNIEYTFGELSDGQKVLVVLYSLFYGLESQDYTLCIDEPENFLALPEIQPWLFQLYDLCSQGKLQALLISHHPELIDYLLASPVGYWFKRESNSSVQVIPIDNNFLQPVINNIQQENQSGLKMSELIIRGWLDE
jgi:predicted ATPase